MVGAIRTTPVFDLGFLFFVFVLISSVIAQNEFADAPARGCGTYVGSEEAATFERQFRELKKRQTGGATVVPTTFNIHWTVVTANETVEGGWIPQAQIDAQLEVLNNDYAEAQISWRLGGVNYVHSRDWFENAGQQTRQERQMKYLFHTGDASTLNLYTIAFNSSSDTLGYATIPQWFEEDPVGDGVVIRYSTLPGGTQPYYRFGRTLTHETGHWLGLFHTFQGGCSGEGDFVSDTSPEAEASRGCPIGRDSCIDGGPDPVQNFMDYSVDQCMTGFSIGQIERMHRFIQGYRRPSSVNYTFPYWGIEDTQRLG